MQVDGIWERDGLLYNPFMAQLLSRKEYYVLRRNIRPDAVELLEEYVTGSGLVPGGFMARHVVMSPWCRTKAYVPAHYGCS